MSAPRTKLASLGLRAATTGLAAIALAAATGCAPQLSAITPAPPDRVLELDADHDRIELSEGVAVAFECTRDGSPCRGVHGSVAAEGVAGVYATQLARLDRGVFRESNVSTLTLVGLKPGSTTLRVSAEGWTHDYTVSVVAAR
ncbi:MAG TPA: hypothetical protein VGG39_26715 [Polyangiaceae bacterium]|jgi:hypothetical protein